MWVADVNLLRMFTEVREMAIVNSQLRAHLGMLLSNVAFYVSTTEFAVVKSYQTDYGIGEHSRQYCRPLANATDVRKFLVGFNMFAAWNFYEI